MKKNLNYHEWSGRWGMREDGSSRWLIGHWYWWRHSHGSPFWTAVRLTFNASVGRYIKLLIGRMIWMVSWRKRREWKRLCEEFNKMT